jgi:hypothetical protein
MANEEYYSDDIDQRTQMPKSCLVSSRIDEMFDHIMNGIPAQTRIGMQEDSGGGFISRRSSSEPVVAGLPAPEEHHMDMDGAFRSALMALGPEHAKAILQEHLAQPTESITTAKGQPIVAAPEQAGFQITKAQYRALTKFPALIEFLGSKDGEKIAQRIASEMATLVVDKVGENSKLISKFAVSCQAERQNIKQYYKGPGWVCRVTASGPFRGDEFIYYDKEKDVAKVLRKASNTRYTNVSGEFNVIHEYAEVEETENETPNEESTG